jgi:hypothetical protein
VIVAIINSNPNYNGTTNLNRYFEHLHEYYRRMFIVKITCS